MSAIRAARAVRVARSALTRTPVQRRGYADAVADKLKLTLALPHQIIYKSQDVYDNPQAAPQRRPANLINLGSIQVNVPAESGEMGILAQHVPSIEQLKPGLIEIIEEAGGSKQFFLSGGFAVVQPDSVLSINAVEGFPLEDFSPEAVASQISEAQKIASGSGSEQDIAEAQIELEHGDESTAPAYDRRTEESSLGSPVSHASREGIDGALGDARLPPGAFDPKLRPSMEEQSDYRVPMHPSALRPSTSLAPGPRERQEPFAPLTRAKSIRGHGPIESPPDPTLQLSAMRARLRPHSEKKPLAPDVTGNRPSDQPLVMADLDDMIDYVKSSIEHQAAYSNTAAVDSMLHAHGNLPDSSMVRRWKSAKGVRPSLGISVPSSLHNPSGQHQRHISSSPAHLATLKSLSPVKAKAAIFESMDQGRATILTPEATLHRHVDVKKTWKSPPGHELAPRREEALHRMNHGPTLHHRRKESTSTTKTASFDTARQFVEQDQHDEPREIPAAVDTTVKPTPDAIPRWRAFSKASSAVPQATEESAMAIPEKDQHYPSSSRPGLVQSRIQGLLASSHRCEEHDQQLKLRQTALPTRNRESEIGDKTPMSATSEQDRLAFLQSSVEAQLESANALAAEVESSLTPRSSTHPSMNEKEVFNRVGYGRAKQVPSQPASVGSASPDKGSPLKAEPSTPRRGRSMLASLPPRGPNYAVEQAFVVSPARSRSRSRASGSRMVVEVELRDSPGPEARETGQKIMFIRADVNDIEEENET
ncbi:hypothetical protein DV737_g1580, partial [Chaetothyriales sp. CBS 132003]